MRIYNGYGMSTTWSKEFYEAITSSINDRTSEALINAKNLFYVTSSNKNTIVDVSIIVPNKVVEVTFMDGDKQKAVCQEPDVFSLEQAISICITKHLLGGTSAYNKAIRKGVKLYNKQLETEKQIKEEEEQIAKKRAKYADYKKRKADKRREEQIEIQKEAYIRAMETMGKVNAN